MTFLVQYIVSLSTCVLDVPPALQNISHTPTARYSLFVLKQQLNTK